MGVIPKHFSQVEFFYNFDFNTIILPRGSELNLVYRHAVHDHPALSSTVHIPYSDKFSDAANFIWPQKYEGLVRLVWRKT